MGAGAWVAAQSALSGMSLAELLGRRVNLPQRTRACAGNKHSALRQTGDQQA
jgi:hypothetical protein